MIIYMEYISLTTSRAHGQNCDSIYSISVYMLYAEPGTLSCAFKLLLISTWETQTATWAVHMPLTGFD